MAFGRGKEKKREKEKKKSGRSISSNNLQYPFDPLEKKSNATFQLKNKTLGCFSNVHTSVCHLNESWVSMLGW